MIDENAPHPKDQKTGSIYWPREVTFWICGDRIRHTVLLLTPDAVLEMTPGAAKKLAEEMNMHADDVQQGDSTAVREAK